MAKLAFVLLSFALVLSAASARGAGRRIALLHGDPELQRALALALSAWDVETVPLDVQLSEESDADARVQAAELVRALHMEGVVWVSPTLHGSRLAVFDAHTGELTVRDLPELPPFASTTAASLALSVKTALRPSVEPAIEQPRESPPPRPAPAPAPRRLDPGVPVFALPSSRVSLRTMLDVAWVADKKLEPHWGLGTTLWLGRRQRLGVALRLSAGSGVSVSTPDLEGRYRDLTVGLGGEWRWLDTGLVSSAVGLGAGLRAATLDGTLSDSGDISVVRYNPNVDAAFRLDVRVAAPFFVGLDVSSCFLVRYQRFLVDGRPVFAPFRLSPSAGVSLGVALF
ncbi:MAG: hypothetical protein ABJB12_03780 [Pseudomonadota bacterium]